jgi:hypothetical protein
VQLEQLVIQVIQELPVKKEILVQRVKRVIPDIQVIQDIVVIQVIQDIVVILEIQVQLE